MSLPPWGGAIAGSMGAVYANTIVYPLDIIKTRLQVQSASDKEAYANVWDAVKKIVEQEGILGLYAGLPGCLVGVASQSFAYFFWYELLRAETKKRLAMSTPVELGVGAAAGALAQIFTIPVAVVTTRQQTAARQERRGIIDTGRLIVQEDGIQGLWAGLKASLVLVVNPSITYGMFERIKVYLYGKKRLTPAQAFIVGALSKTLATVVTYPYIMAKVRMQWKPSKLDGHHHQRPYDGAVDVLRKVYAKDGVVGLYKGMGAQISKAVLSQAILFYYKEIFTGYTMLAIALARNYLDRDED